jgi:hypothetical protein
MMLLVSLLVPRLYGTDDGQVWMLPRGDLHSGYDLGPGGFIAIAAELAALWVPVSRVLSRRRALR